MSLLHTNLNKPMERLAQKVFDKQFELDPRLQEEYDDRQKMLMYDDIIYNLGYLQNAIVLDDDSIFENYAIWIYQLLFNLMKDLGRDRLKEHMVTHYKVLKESLEGVLSSKEVEKANHILDKAIAATELEAAIYKPSQNSERFQTGKYAQIRESYLNHLINNETREALELVKNKSQTGLSLEEIYQDIMQEVMYEVGNLWHSNNMTVDKEHYCTSTTQTALSQFYSEIFSQPKSGYKILVCCVGSELHEMGARMLSDLFEYKGWDSVYLGAAVPKDSIISAIREHKPDLLALSVTMPHHLIQCRDTAEAVRKEFPSLKIAVGGRSFQVTADIWKSWDVDISTYDAKTLISWAEENIINKGVV